MKYRKVAPAYEAIPTYRYECSICQEPITGPHTIKNRWSVDGGYHVPGQKAVDVLHNGQTITVHETCNH